ncbi:hypothetical protein FHT77_001657 [Rhizobium sp. BK181]|nr:hypothetical protein [Rhizobium sp. BK181]
MQSRRRQLGYNDVDGDTHNVGCLLIAMTFDNNQQKGAGCAFGHVGDHAVDDIGVDEGSAIAVRFPDISDIAPGSGMRLASAMVVAPMLAGEGVHPTFQTAFAIPLIALCNGALARHLREFVRARCVTGKGHRETP